MPNVSGNASEPGERRRVLAIGLDGGDIDFILARRAALPTLARALDDGRLQRTAAPKALSGSVWPTFYSGRDPGAHGMYQHLVWDAERMGLRRIAPDWCCYRPFWQTLERDGHDVVVLDVPYSFPTSLERGAEIIDWGTHGQTWPMSSNRTDVDALVKRFGASPIGRETPVEKTQSQLDAICRRLKASAERKGALIQTLMRELDWDVFVTVFGETHRAGHLFFGDADDPRRNTPAEPTAMLDVYGAVDKALGRVLEAAGPQTSVVLFSVHGMMRNPAQEHLVTPLMDRFNAWFLREHGGLADIRPQSRGGLIGYLRRKVPARLQHAVGAAAPDFVRQWVVEREMIGGLDWTRTPGFALRTDIRTELRLNLKGREAQGFLEPGSDLHRAYVTTLEDTFLGLRDVKTGEALVDEVVDLHAEFPGEHTDRLPDFAVTWRPVPAAQKVHAPRLGAFEVTRPGVRGGDHTDDGFALLLARDGDDLPDLSSVKTTADFAGFIRALADENAPNTQVACAAE